MRIVIVGAGEVGRFLCQTLSDKGHDVTAIESSPDTVRDLEEFFNIKVIEDNGSSAQVLKRAGVKGAAFFLAMTSDDRTNLIACSLAKALGAQTTIARIHDQTYADNSLVNYQVHFGIDFLLNPEALSAVQLAKAIRHPGRVAVEQFARGEIEVQQVRLSPRSKIVSQPLRDVRLQPGVRVIMLQREGHTEVPSASTVLEPGDWITIIGPTENLAESKKIVEPGHEQENVRVVLFGASETAIALIRLLKNPRFKIRVIEGNEKFCRDVAERFSRVTVIHGSATSLRLLEDEQIGAADYFVACTKDDEENIMTCLQAKQLGVKHVGTIFNKPDYEEIVDQLRRTLGVEMAVSPRRATVEEVMRYISTETFFELATLPHDAGKIIEVKVSSESQLVNKELRELNFPAGAQIVALLHKFQAKVPSASDKIVPGDRVVVAARPDSIDNVVRLLTER